MARRAPARADTVPRVQRLEVCFVSYGSVGHLRSTITTVRDRVPDACIAIQEHAPDARDTEAQRAELVAAGASCRVQHDPSNPGFGAGCNALARSSTAAWLLFLNPDAALTRWEVDVDALDPSVVYGPAVFEGRRPESHRGRSYRIIDELSRSWLRRSGHAPDGTGFVSGAALLVSADAFARVGGFDEGYFLFYEDIDLCLRANAMGVRTELLPGVAVHHTGGHSTAADPSGALNSSYESGCKFHASQGESVRLYRLYVAVDAIARAALHALRRRRVRARAYASLAHRAGREAITRGHT